jgi:hypothetical protein
MKRVYTAANSLMVDHLKMVLDQAGIDSVVQRRFLSGAVGEIPPTEAWPELWVLDDEQEERARELVAAASAAPERSGQRQCLACGERLAAQFDTCWKCGAAVGSLLRDPQFRSDAAPPPASSWRLSRNAVYWLIWAAMAWIALEMVRDYTR